MQSNHSTRFEINSNKLTVHFSKRKPRIMTDKNAREGRTTCNQCDIIRSTETRYQKVSNEIMSSTYNDDDDDDDIKKVVALRGEFTNLWMCWLNRSMVVCVCVCKRVFVWYFFRAVPASPFDLIIQWCTSLKYAQTHTQRLTHTETCAKGTETSTLFETFLFMLQQRQIWRLLPVSALLLLPEFCEIYIQTQRERKRERVRWDEKKIQLRVL